MLRPQACRRRRRRRHAIGSDREKKGKEGVFCVIGRLRLCSRVVTAVLRSPGVKGQHRNLGIAGMGDAVRKQRFRICVLQFLCAH